MKSILICHPGRAGSHWLLYMLSSLTGLVIPEMEPLPGAPGFIWGTREQRTDLESLQGQIDILFLLRDPRDVETSMRLYEHIQPGHFTQEADAILENLGWFRWYLEQRPDRYSRVRYEDLWRTPVSSLMILLTHMRRAWTIPRIQEAVERELFVNRSGGRVRGEENVHHHLRKGVIGDWKNHWSEEKHAAFMGKFSKEMHQLGY